MACTVNDVEPLVGVSIYENEPRRPEFSEFEAILVQTRTISRKTHV